MSDDLAFGVIGLGFGANHARVLTEIPGVRLAAVCDQDEDRLAAAAKGRDLHTYTDYARMLCEETLDAVVIAVPASKHEAVALAAIAAGCALLVEKPLAPSLEEGRRLVSAASAAGVPLMAGHIERFNPAVRELARRVQAGEIGNVLQLTARRMGPIVVRAQDVNVVHDTALHDVDVMHYVLGAGVDRVYAEAQTGLLKSLEDSITAVLRFAPRRQESGPSASLIANWRSPRPIRDLTVLGELGLFSLDYATQTLSLVSSRSLPESRAGTRGWSPSPIKDASDAERIPVEPAEPLRQELLAFVTALRNHEPMPVTADDALAALSVCDALTESARTGQPVVPAPVR